MWYSLCSCTEATDIVQCLGKVWELCSCQPLSCETPWQNPSVSWTEAFNSDCVRGSGLFPCGLEREAQNMSPWGPELYHTPWGPALCTRADGRVLERLTSPFMKKHLQIHPVRSLSYVNREAAVNGVNWVLLCWESILEFCANGWRDLIKNIDTVTSQAKYFKLFKPTLDSFQQRSSRDSSEWHMM